MGIGQDLDQWIGSLFLLAQLFEGSWEYASLVYIHFMDLEKAYDSVPRLLVGGTERIQGNSVGEYEAAGMKISTSMSEATHRANNTCAIIL